MMKLLLALVVITLYVVNAQKTVTEIITKQGYPAEEHKTITTDGYVLTMNRIPHGKSVNATKGPVFFQHGLLDSSFAAVANPPPEGLAFYLADLGYDVWLGNNRGNGISMEHVKYTPKDKEFWDFSWDDMAKYDLPAQLLYVTRATGQKKIPYMGHSQGTVQAFSGFLEPSTAEMVSVFIAFAPVAFVTHIKVQILKLLAAFELGPLLQLLGVRQLNIPTLLKALVPNLCAINPPACEFVFVAFSGDFTYKNSSQIAFYTKFEPAPTSTKTLIQWSQGILSNAFQMYDYGKVQNLIKYGQLVPPVYDLSKFPKDLPVAMFTGTIDALSDPEDVERLISRLPTKPYVHNEPSFGHLDFTLGYTSYKTIYPLAVKQIEKYSTYEKK